MTEKNACPNPVGYFVFRGDKGQINKYPVACKSWTCPVCGPKKKRKFLYSLKCATNRLKAEGYRFRGLTLTLGPDAKNSDLGKYWHRFRMALKKAGHQFDYIWVKEFQKNGKLHLHAIITAFIPWGLIKYYWSLATQRTSSIVWIANAQIRYTAAYISKYISKSLTEAPFRKGERRFGMSKKFRDYWPKMRKMQDEFEGEFEGMYVFVYKPDNSKFLKKAKGELTERIKRRKAWKEETGLTGKCRASVSRRKKRRKMKHNKSGILNNIGIRAGVKRRKKRNKSNLAASADYLKKSKR